MPATTPRSRSSKATVAFMVILLGAALGVQAWLANLPALGFRQDPWEGQRAQAYTEALAKGQAHFLQQPDPRLATLANPYARQRRCLSEASPWRMAGALTVLAACSGTWTLLVRPVSYELLPAAAYGCLAVALILVQRGGSASATFQAAQSVRAAERGRRAARRVQLRAVRQPARVRLQLSVSIDYTKPHTLELRYGSFLPPDGHSYWNGASSAEREAARQTLTVLLDDKPVLHGKAFFHRPRGLTFIGQSPFDAAFGPTFTGKILNTDRPPLPPRNNWFPSAR